MRLEPAVEEAESGSTMTVVDVPEDTTFGFTVYSLRLRVQGAGFRVPGFGFRVRGFGLRVEGLGFGGCS